MASPPKVTALLMCDTTTLEADEGKTSLHGIHDHITAPSLPFVSRPFAIYFKVASLNGEYLFGIQIVSAEGDAVVVDAPLRPPISCRDPLIAIGISIEFPGVQFDAPGRYIIRLLYNGIIADTAILTVSRL